jgi:hypothetical protein
MANVAQAARIATTADADEVRAMTEADKLVRM